MPLLFCWHDGESRWSFVVSQFACLLFFPLLIGSTVRDAVALRGKAASAPHEASSCSPELHRRCSWGQATGQGHWPGSPVLGRQERSTTWQHPLQPVVAGQEHMSRVARWQCLQKAKHLTANHKWFEMLRGLCETHLWACSGSKTTRLSWARHSRPWMCQLQPDSPFLPPPTSLSSSTKLLVVLPHAIQFHTPVPFSHLLPGKLFSF